MADEVDKGNPNFFAIYQGRYTASLVGPSSTSDVVMLTSTNMVQFTGDCTSAEDGVMWILPEECRPVNPVRFLCAIQPTGITPGASYEVVADIEVPISEKSVVTGVTAAMTQKEVVTEVTASSSQTSVIGSVNVGTDDIVHVTSVGQTTYANFLDAGSAATNGITAAQYSGLKTHAAVTSISSANETTNAVVSVSATAKSLTLTETPVTTMETIELVGMPKPTTEKLKLAGEPVVSKANIKVPDVPGATFAVVTVSADGSVTGLPNTLHYTNGCNFNISDRWYLEE